MELEGVRYVAAAYALAFLVLLVWVAMIGAKIRRLDGGDGKRKQS